MSHIHTHTHRFLLWYMEREIVCNQCSLALSLLPSHHGKIRHHQLLAVHGSPSLLFQSCVLRTLFLQGEKSNTFVFWWSSIHTYCVICSESFASTHSFSFFIITWELTICPLPITYTFKINNLCRNIFSITLAPTIMILFIAIISLRVNIHIFNWKKCRQDWLEGIALNFNGDIPKHMKYYSLSVNLKILSFITYLCQKG